MRCPHCLTSRLLYKTGFYIRRKDQRRIQRFKCGICRKKFSDQTFRVDYRLRLRHLNKKVFYLLNKGVSQRGCALVLNTTRATIDRRVVIFGKAAKAQLTRYRKNREPVAKVQVDEMESFEHTKCKPVTIAIAVEEKTRMILYAKAGSIAAKGPLAKISRKKYGPRLCERAKILDEMFGTLKEICLPHVEIKSDESHHYPLRIKALFPLAVHKTYKGRRGCVVGQGELKRGGFDPLFSLNHTYAMIRDNIKRLTRRTWCTTKLIERLEYLVHIYAWFHNQMLSGIRPSIAFPEPN